MIMIVPELRFKADNGSEFPAWEEKELGQVLKEDLYPVPNPEGAYTKLAIRSHGKGTFDKRVEAGESLDVDKMYEVKADHVILNITFAWELAIAVTSEKDEGKLVSHRFPQYKIVEGDSNFYKYHLIDERMRYDLGLASPGGAGRNRVLNRKDFLKIKRYIPCLEEQQKIASFFSDLDEVISKSEAEVAALEKQKKGVMQKIFSQEVRFKRDDGSEYPDWEEKKLDEVVNFLDGQRKPLESGQRISGPYPYYGASGIIDYVNDYIFDDELILLSEDGANILDRNYRVSFLARGKYWVNNHAHVLKAINGNVNSFICEQLEMFDYKKYNSGGAQPKLNQATCRSLILQIPDIEEQQKIAACLSDFDTAINLAKQELEKWKLLKKGLMQQMFV